MRKTKKGKKKNETYEWYFFLNLALFKNLVFIRAELKQVRVSERRR